jgi:hypothetical protein
MVKYIMAMLLKLFSISYPMKQLYAFGNIWSKERIELGSYFWIVQTNSADM